MYEIEHIDGFTTPVVVQIVVRIEAGNRSDVLGIICLVEADSAGDG
ncbi:hypothetical protein JMUB7504_27190 [Staphylococcus aureus]